MRGRREEGGEGREERGGRRGEGGERREERGERREERGGRREEGGEGREERGGRRGEGGERREERGGRREEGGERRGGWIRCYLCVLAVFQMVIHMLCTYLDSHMPNPRFPDGRTFSLQYFIKHPDKPGMLPLVQPIISCQQVRQKEFCVLYA